VKKLAVDIVDVSFYIIKQKLVWDLGCGKPGPT